MKFPHEQLQSSIESFERSIELLKEKLKDPEWQHRAGIIWEIDSYINLHELRNSFWTTSNDEEIMVYFWKAVSVEGFQDFFDYIEELFEEHGFIMSLGETPNTYEKSKYYFVHEDGTKIPLTIASGVCKQVNTGRMIPETKTDCGFLEG